MSAGVEAGRALYQRRHPESSPQSEARARDVELLETAAGRGALERRARAGDEQARDVLAVWRAGGAE